MELNAKSQADRHAHGGGHPGHAAKQVRRGVWIPACAGMTLVVVLAVISSGALAHTGVDHEYSFFAGLRHPFTGADHTLAMVAVGLWAGLNGGRALWAWPLAFVGLMIAGGVLGAAEISLPWVEPGILASVVVLGLLIVMAVQLPVAAGVAIIALFALLHGHAHGSEVHLELAALPHALGFVAATAILHAVGVGTAYIATGDYGRLAVRGAGALVAAIGIYLALTGGAGA